ncbi:MAG: APC family permease [Candidatus Jordarchaeum sp.]|uniref:APC family permease n=1 Tax=Candidatus Jordarchaeum sp. TaxID=2823881 RepID=UPI00404AF213
MEEESVKLVRKLTLFDVTNLVVGAIIGADIFVAASFGANLVGPASLLVWIAAGVFMTIIALNFAQCAMISPVVGGPYAYAKEAFGKFTGFIVGWSTWVAEWFSLAVFPVAFVQYLMYFFPYLTFLQQVIVIAAFIGFLTVTNVLGTKAAGRSNDILTIGKLAPLILFIAVGLVYTVSNFSQTTFNLTPFAPLGYSQFGSALVLIAWAYAGFELSTIPAGEIEDAEKTIPRAILTGMLIVLVFYLAINFVIISAIPWYQLENLSTPLTTTTQIITGYNSQLASWGYVPWTVTVATGIIGVGALLSISGADESGTLGTSRISYAMALDGLFPRLFAKLHPKFKTPYIGLIIQNVSALVAAIYGNLDLLISSSVLFLSVAYLVTCISAPVLRKKHPQAPKGIRGGLILAIIGAACCVFLITQIKPLELLIGAIIFAIGIPIYLFFSPKETLSELKIFLSRREILKRAWEMEHVFLAHILKHIKRLYRKSCGKEQTWSC